MNGRTARLLKRYTNLIAKPEERKRMIGKQEVTRTELHPTTKEMKRSWRLLPYRTKAVARANMTRMVAR